MKYFYHPYENSIADPKRVLVFKNGKGVAYYSNGIVSRPESAWSNKEMEKYGYVEIDREKALTLVNNLP